MLGDAAQKHIYCDKPLVATPAEAEEVRAALRDYRGVAQMTFQNRFYPATMRAKQLVDAGALGRVLEFAPATCTAATSIRTPRCDGGCRPRPAAA